MMLAGYPDRLSLRPGETIAFKVSSRADEPYEARLVRVVCGDPNPEGPGMKEVPLEAPFAGRHPSRFQPTHLGSYLRVDPGRLELARPLTVVATLWPTTPEKPAQSVLSWLAPGGGGLALQVDGTAGATVLVGTAGGTAARASVGKAMRPRAWYRIWASVDPGSGAVSVGQAPLVPALGVDDAGTADAVHPGVVLAARGPLLIAAQPGEPPGGHYNGKIEHPRILAGALSPAEALAAAAEPAEGGAVVAAWDFSREIASPRVPDVGPAAAHAELVNLPSRAMTGSAWTGAEHCWRHAPEHYAAIHFHEEDLYDCGWESDFSYTVPAGMPSGAYAVRLAVGGEGEMIPFFVLPPRGRPGADVCVLMPTFTYVVYGNYSRGVTTDEYRARVAAWGARPWNPDEHPEYSLSTYNFHRDGSGIGIASRLRPMLNMRSGFLSYVDQRGSGLRHYPADTHLLDWLEAKGVAFDVITDEDLDDEGGELIAPYRAVLTTSHPEYHTAGTLDALEGYVAGGGRLAYLGGNGFYWRVARHPAFPGAIEVRRAEGGIRVWAAEPGEYYHAFDGAYGGLWRRNGRPPQGLVGVGFSAQGMFEGTCYVTGEGAADPRVRWIFEGLEASAPGSRLGDFGLSGGGAAGFELDRLDRRLGSPDNAVVLATSVEHPDHFVCVPEELLTHLTTWPGEPPAALIRADMVYFDAPNGGAVFSVGSITFCGSLAHNGYDNDISRLLENVLRRFRGG